MSGASTRLILSILLLAVSACGDDGSRALPSQIKVYPSAQGSLLLGTGAAPSLVRLDSAGYRAEYEVISDTGGSSWAIYAAGVQPPFEVRINGELQQLDFVSAQSCLYDSFSRWDTSFSIACTVEDLNVWVQSRGGVLEDLICDSSLQPYTSFLIPCVFHWGGERVLYSPWTGFQFAPPVIRTRDVVRNAFRSTLMPPSVSLESVTPALMPAGSVPPSFTERFQVATQFSGNLNVFVRPGRAGGRFEGHAAIYIEGHGGSSLDIGADSVAWLADLGFTVYAMDLPVTGSNEAAAAQIVTHADLAPHEWETLNPVWTEFLAPIQAVTEHARSQKRFRTIGAYGRSGGAWAAYAAGAISEQIDYVVSISGGTPHSMRLAAASGPYEVGDWEQYAPRIYNVVGHEELMLASGRLGGFFFYSAHDPCCYALASDDPFIHWLNASAVSLGREIRAYADDAGIEHGVTQAGRDEIERFVGRIVDLPNATR